MTEPRSRTGGESFLAALDALHDLKDDIQRVNRKALERFRT